jgi:hypothetical protein
MRINTLLWIVQGLLSALFVFAGGMKLVLPSAAMAAQMPLPVPFMRFIGIAEVAGAAGLILPWALRIQPRLTALAATGLAIIMVGATSLTLAGSQPATAAVPFVVGLLSVAIAYGRRVPSAVVTTVLQPRAVRVS